MSQPNIKLIMIERLFQNNNFQWEKVIRLPQHKFVSYIYSQQLQSKKGQWYKRSFLFCKVKKSFFSFAPAVGEKTTLMSIHWRGKKKKKNNFSYYTDILQCYYHLLALCVSKKVQHISLKFKKKKNNIYESINSDQNTHHKIIPLLSEF